nr:MAG TPA: hypothetical protein [Bacteriophage sp.]
MKFETPIFDRTLDNINSLKILLEKGYKNFTEKERSDWKSNLKGALNISDLNRIENNIAVVAEILSTTLTTKTDWKETDIPQQSDFLRIQSNVLNLRSKVASILTNITPNVPDLPYNYYSKINDIERILFDIYNLLSHQEHYYCGEGTSTSQIEIYSGENIGIL